ncbi:MAG: amidohydrolase [Alphaproteobacteria bacterium]|nr:MAG: amidohydrolase [Alphaproteobacteria bacterium]
MARTAEEQSAWLDQVQEVIIDPERRIIDPHHHLWRNRERPYLLDELWADTGTGHKVEKTVFIECGSEYRAAGPEHLKPVGETEFVAEIAKASRAGPGPEIAGIVAHANLLSDRLEEILDAHEEAADGLFRGIRHSGAFDDAPQIRAGHSNPPKDLFLHPTYQASVREIGARGHTLDVWCYHKQIPQVTELARAAPETILIFDHFGGPLGIGPYEGQHAEIFKQWREDVAELATCPNVHAKLGGFAMVVNGWGWDKRGKPATSDELVAAQGDWYAHTLDCFGPERCLFESNYPMDRQSISYGVLWNAFKKMAKNFSEEAKDALFYGNSKQIYRL